MTKITIATPAYGETFYASYVKSVLSLQRTIDRRGWGSSFATISYADVVEARNYLLTRWFDHSDATHLLFIDADMGFEPPLVTDMIAFDKPLVGVIYPKRQVDLDRLASLAAKGEPADVAIARAHDFIYRPLNDRTPKREKGFLEVEGCGTGLMLIRRDCIETMLNKLPDLSDKDSKISTLMDRNMTRLIRAFDNLRVGDDRLSEDYSFCHRWRHLCGGEIWANIEHAITHVGIRHFKAKFEAARKGPRVVVKIGKDEIAAGAKAAATPEGQIGKTVTGRIKLPR
jgi:hypothetical protein